MQETEVNHNLDQNLLGFPGYHFESESISTYKARVGCYIKSGIDYVRRTELEGKDSHLIILDIRAERDLRIINVYRSFNPLIPVSAKTLFENQLILINNAYTSNTILLGDFNLDWNRKGQLNYPFKNYFDCMDEVIAEHSLIQLVNFPTWSRTVQNEHRESIIDHIYTNNPSYISDVTGTTPYFGDHLLISFVYSCANTNKNTTYKRCWRGYTKELLCQSLNNTNWEIYNDDVQGYWNEFENRLINVVDSIVPTQEFKSNSGDTAPIPAGIKNQMNLRKKLLRKYRFDKSLALKWRIKELSINIKQFFHKTKAKEVRRKIVPGNSGSLWAAVNSAKNINNVQLPPTMFHNGIEINKSELSEQFANYFDKKIRNVKDQATIDDSVYNGTRKAWVENEFFMGESQVLECVKSLKNKNSEGYDRIPQRILVDGAEALALPLSTLFNKIYHQRTIPGQWLVSKTIPIYKNKGDKKAIDNYRPIANLCSASKIFEKLILKRIIAIGEGNGIDLTNKNQHGFKKAKSTTTLSLELQSLIARALDEDKTVLVSSLDLSSAFDVVNVKLLLKRMRIIGLPEDIIELVAVWLKNRVYYVSIDEINSTLFDILLGTVQGSILSPILYAIFVSPLFDIEELLAFADDTFIPKVGESLAELIEDMEKSLEAITKWLKQSGLVVNKAKTEICVFNRRDLANVNIKIGNDTITSKNQLSVLGVIFDSKLQWSIQVMKSIQKSNRALCAVKLISRYFNTKELLLLLTSNFYSVLFYNSEVWYIKSLKEPLKHLMFTASARALRVAMHYPKQQLSYLNLHKLTNRATPEMFSTYKLALTLYKLYNSNTHCLEWIHLNIEHVSTSRQTSFIVKRNNTNVTGSNALTARLFDLNGQIPLTWLNNSFQQFKIKCKSKFLSFI